MYRWHIRNGGGKFYVRFGCEPETPCQGIFQLFDYLACYEKKDLFENEPEFENVDPVAIMMVLRMRNIANGNYYDGESLESKV